ncbi:MAG TPA: methyl-accepting chemotaxis protein [Baekduia sp.]|jgi:methyl-accepting chemotaxis protein
MKLRQSVITAIAAGLFAVLTLALIAGVLFARHSFDKVESTAERRAEFTQLGIDQADSSKLLTNKVREFAVTNQKTALDQYWAEVDNNTQAKILTRLKQLGSPQSELDLLALSHKKSAGLVNTETRAQRLVLDAQGVDPAAMPAPVAAWKVSASDRALSDTDKIARARNLVYGAGYNAAVTRIMAPVSTFQHKMAQRTQGAFDDASASARGAMTLLIVLTILMALGMTAVLLIFHTQVARVIGRHARRLRDRDAEDFDFRLDRAGTVELVDLADRMNEQFLDQEALRDNKRLIADTAELIARVSDAADVVTGASHQMESVSDEAGRATTEIAHAVTEVATGAQQQVEAVEATQVLTQQMAESTASSAEAARHGTEAAARAGELARTGADSVQQASEAMEAVRTASANTTTAIRDLGAKSEQIGGIVASITGIAEQTNLLALNAAIEAARAGEQGRGFAVVAEEVRKLAEESQHAAASISVLIAEIQAETGRAVSVVESSAVQTEQGAATVEQAKASFEEIAASVTDVNDHVVQIAAAIQEIAATSARVRENVAGVATVAEQSSAAAEEVSASTEQTSASTREIGSSARALTRTAEELKGLVGEFKLTV